MKKITTIVLLILTGSVLVSGAFANTEAATPAKAETVKATPAVAIAQDSQNNVADASYTIGYSIGENMTKQLKQQNVTLNTDDLQQGFVAGIEGSKARLSQEQMEQSMQAFQKEMEEKMKAPKATEATDAKSSTKTATTPVDNAKQTVDTTNAAAN